MNDNPDAVGMAYLSYFQPRGEYTVTATYHNDTQSISLSRPEEATILPDLGIPPQKIVYRHHDLYEDEAAIEIDSQGLLARISTRSKDQSIEIAKKVSQIIEQFGAIATAEKVSGFVGPMDNCKPRTVRASIGLTSPLRGEKKDDSHDIKGVCKLSLTLDVTREVALDPDVKRAQVNNKLSDGCPPTAVCVRIAGGFTVRIHAHLKVAAGIIGCEKGECNIDIDEDVTVIAPMATPLGRIYFNRRQFVENETAVTFTKGMVTKIEAKNPSAFANALDLPIELLKSVSLLIRL